MRNEVIKNEKLSKLNTLEDKSKKIQAWGDNEVSKQNFKMY